MNQNQNYYEYMTKTYQLVFTAPNGGTIEVHDEHYTKELAENQFFSVTLALAGKHVKLLPYSFLPNAKNPDADIDGKVADFKFPYRTQSPHSAIQALIKDASTQKVEIVVLYLGNPLIVQRDVKRALIAALQTGWNRSIQEVWLIYPDWVVVEIRRSEVDDRSFIGKLK